MRLCFALPLLFAPLAACVEDPADSSGPIVDSGAYHHYAQTRWDLPLSASEARRWAFDLDDDAVGDNQAGAVIGALAGIGLDLQGASAAGFASGAVVVLHSVRADSLVHDADVSWRLLDGVAPGAPRFDGSDGFVVTGEAGLLVGAIDDGVLTAGHGAIAIRLPLFPDQPALALPLVAAQVELAPIVGACHGRLGGAIRTTVVTSVVVPALAAQVVEHMARHPDHEFTRSARQVFDADHDGVATAAEIAGSDLTRALFRPDLDLDGDQVDDALSFAVGFDCVPATFTAVE